jgi:hypothetical protein
LTLVTSIDRTSIHRLKQEDQNFPLRARIGQGALLGALLIMLSQQAFAWQIMRGSNGNDVQAILGMTVVDGANAAVIIDFIAKFECNPMLTFLEYRGQPLGTPITKTAQRGSRKMTISAGNVSASFFPWVIEYTNGSEMVCNEPVCSPVLEAIVQGHNPIQIDTGLGRALQFPIIKDATAIRRAQLMCISTLRGLQ